MNETDWEARAKFYAECVYDLWQGGTNVPVEELIEDELIDPETHDWIYEDEV